MSLAIAALLGAIQGLTEFLPVSSSGHVSLGAMLFSLKDLPLGAVLIVHIGTLVATLIVLKMEVWEPPLALLRNLRNPLQNTASREAVGIVAGSVPTAVIGLGLRDMVEHAAHQPLMIGGAFLITSALLLITRLKVKQRSDIPIWIYIIIGIAQGLAVAPGISRSGSTIAAGLLLGLSSKDAFRISFLLSLPAIVGATLLEVLRGSLVIDTPALVSGVVAMVTGVGALVLLRNLVTNGRLWMFAFYLIPAAIAVFVFG